MRNIRFLTLALALTVSVGAQVFAQETPAPATSTPMGAPPAATSELPFVNEGANQPMLQPLSPDGLPVEEGHGAEAAHGKKKGLPQFDTSTFARQLFWLTLVFSCLYLVFANKTLPAISSVLENRRTRIASDLRAAEELKREIERVRGEYESAIVHAQSKAQSVIGMIQDDIKRTMEARDAEFKAKADEAVKALESKIAGNRTRVMGELNNLAAELAVDITNKLTGVKTDASAARAVIDAETSKAKAA